MKYFLFLMGLLLMSWQPQQSNKGYLHIWGKIISDSPEPAKVSVINMNNKLAKEVILEDEMFDFKLPLGYDYLFIFSKSAHQIKLLDVSTHINKDTIYRFGFNVLLPLDSCSNRSVINIGKLYYDERVKAIVHKMYSGNKRD